MRSRCRVPLLMFLGGCTHTGAPLPAPDAVSAVADEIVHGVVHVTWHTDAPGVGRVAYVDSYGDARETPPEAAPTTEHAVAVLGLLPGADAELTAFTEVDGVDGASGSVTITAPRPTANAPAAVTLGDGEGYVLTHLLSESFASDAVVVYDRNGQPVWSYTPAEEGRILSAAVAADGTLWFASNPSDYVHTLGYVYHLSLDGSVHEVLPLEAVHSGVVPLPEGGIGYISKHDEPWADGHLLWDTIDERAADGTTRTVYDPLATLTPVQLCEHWNVQVQADPDTAYFDWTHANSLLLSEDGTAWYVMMRFLDAVFKVDRASGQVLWVLGGLTSDFAFDGGPVNAFSHAHMSVFDEHRALIFDNADHEVPAVSRAAEYDLDPEAGTATLVRQVPEPGGRFVASLGDVKDAPDGGLLIAWTMLGRISEVDADNATRWQLDLPLGLATGRVTLLDALYPASE